MDHAAQPIGSLGDRLRQARKALGLSQADLALKIGVSQPAVATWESGMHDPRRDVLTRVATVLGVPFDWLAAGTAGRVGEDRSAAAAYIRRPMQNVPILSKASMARFAQDRALDPYLMAEDYVPIATTTETFVAMVAEQDAEALDFASGSVLIFNHVETRPADAAIVLTLKDGALGLSHYRALEGDDSAAAPVEIVGCLRVSIRIH